MAVLYSGIEDHDYLSAKSLALGSKLLLANQELAEMLLVLDEPTFSVARDLSEIRLAIVTQINFQVAQGIDPIYQKSAASSHTKQSVVYRDIYIDPRAQWIVDRVKARSGIDTPNSRFGTLTSLRTND